MSEVPPHFHKDDRISAKDLIPNGDYVSVVPDWEAPEGTEVLYLNGSDFRIYRMLSGTWHVLGSSAFTSRVRVRLSADQTVGSASTAVKIKFDTEDYDDDSEFTTANPFYRFDATNAGTYLIHLNLVFDDAGAGEIFSANIFKNGAQYSRNTVIASGSVAQSISLTDQLKLDASDYIEFYGVSSAGGSRKFLHDATTGTFATIHRLS